MIQSMTGYGKASGKVNGSTIHAEIRSLNSKSIEIGLRIPQAYRDREPALRRLISEKIQRGKVDFTLTGERPSGSANHFDQKTIGVYIKELKRIAADNKLGNERLLPLALSLPDAMKEERVSVTDSQWRTVMQIINRAVKDFQKFRDQEGKAIEKDLVARLKEILKMAARLETLEPGRMSAMRARLDKMKAQVRNGEADQNRFEQELIIYLERMDITEEKIRLQSHCSYFLETALRTSGNGKKLGFITQEIGREINTIGAKANDANLQRIVVMMKDELEKIKEQLANVL